MAQAEVLFLATFHLAEVEPALVLGAEGQSSLDDLVDGVAAFRPTKVTVEAPVGEDVALQQHYDQWRSGDGGSMTSETAQLGFRLAERCGLDRLYPVDLMWRFYEESVEDLCSRDQRCAGLWAGMLAWVETQTADLHNRLGRESLHDALRHCNEPSVLGDLLAGYFRHLLPLADGEDAPGPKMIANWYERNLMIMREIHAVLEPGDRAVVIYGHDHVPVLQQFAEAMSDLTVVPALDFL